MTPGGPAEGERGAASSLSVVLLTPLLLVVAFAAFHAALWSHARTEARVRVREVTALIARSGVDAVTAERMVIAAIDSRSLLREVDVLIDESPATVTVVLRGRAPGLWRSITAPIEVSSQMWREGWQP